MLAKSIPSLPSAPGMSYEPKWDGFRCIVFRDGDEVELASRGGKTLTRYFPEVVEQARAQLPARCAVDGGLIVIRRGGPIPRAAARVKLPPEQLPASFVAFDLLALGDENLMGQPHSARRERLTAALS